MKMPHRRWQYICVQQQYIQFQKMGKRDAEADVSKKSEVLDWHKLSSFDKMIRQRESVKMLNTKTQQICHNLAAAVVIFSFSHHT